MDLQQQVYAAIPKGDLAELQKSVNTGFDVNSKISADGIRMTPLQLAIMQNNDVLVKYLLEQGANPNYVAASSSAQPYLLTAALHGSLAIVELLLKAGAIANMTYSHGRTALSELQKAATPPGQAKARAAILQRLLKEEEVAKVPQPKSRPNAVGDGSTKLSGEVKADDVGQAMYRNDVSALQRLISNGLDVNACLNGDNFHSKPLFDAAFRGNIQALKLLLEHGADPNFQPLVGTDSSEPLCVLTHGAADEESVRQAMRVLFNSGSNVNVADEQGRNVLFWAIFNYRSENKKGWLEVIKLLLECGAEIQENSVEKAFRHSTAELIRLLMAHGLDNGKRNLLRCLFDGAARFSSYSNSVEITTSMPPRLEALEVILEHSKSSLSAKMQFKALQEALKARWIVGGSEVWQLVAVPFMAKLVKHGAREWNKVPTPCPELEQALFSVWDKAPADLPELMKRLTPAAKASVHATLRVLYKIFPQEGYTEIRMQIMDFVFN